ncbi:MAG: class I SAM-dependent methyltransferase [Atribacterota bacterium]|nr:class I SAM-dependent methyltransferase [Atribacterota bacterium]
MGYRLLIDPLLASTRKNIAALINPDVEILDLGCGTGELVFELSHKVKKAVGLDIDENMIKYAQLKKEKLVL